MHQCVATRVGALSAKAYVIEDKETLKKYEKKM